MANNRSSIREGTSPRLWDVCLEEKTCTCRTHGPGAPLRIREQSDRKRPTLSCKRCDRPPSRPDRRRNEYLWSQYKMTSEEFDRRLTAQNGRCAICREEMPDPHVDHCHTTGRVRGLLCRYCNLALGFFRDDPERLSRAVKYLA